MPPHRIYIEPFLGGGAIMKMKRPACSSIGIDADADVVAQCHRWTTPPNLTVVHADALEWLPNTDFSNDTLIYLDPPYMFSTRRSQRQIYRYELTDAQHQQLLASISNLGCMVMISGYWSEMYADALCGWRTSTFKTRTRGGNTATEWLWMNFPEPLELHDYQYLGKNFRERERIKRKTQRWKNRLLAMKPLDRMAIMAAISEIRPSPSEPAAPIAISNVLARVNTPELMMQARIAIFEDATRSYHH